MVYVSFLILGAAASATVLLVCYLSYFHLLRIERRRVNSWNARLIAESAKLEEHIRLTEARLSQADKTSAARVAQVSMELAQRDQACNDAISSRQQRSAQALAACLDEIEKRKRACNESLAARIREIDNRQQQSNSEIEERKRACNESLAARIREIDNRQQQLDDAVAAFESRRVTYDSLLLENGGLKQDCFNLSVEAKKMKRNQAMLAQRQQELNARADEIADRYLRESVSWIGERLNPNNFSTCKQRLLNVVRACRSIGFYVPEEEEAELVQTLQKNFEQAVRDEFARQEQARIKSQIREEEKLARETEKQIKDAEREKAAIKAALEKALRETEDEHSAEVELLKNKLKEAEEKAQRAISQAQLTKAGHVYVLSNIGSFGEGIFKVGMTRRLEPQERVSELSSASVPFPYDVHMMISCDNAPALENALHKELHKQRVNKVNLRKEFFRVDLDKIRQIVESQHGVVDYRAEPEALQYRETIDMPDEDYEFIEQTTESVLGDANGSLPDEE
ncbi:MAG: GIY-YIG nuclease family protein [Planctomycetaceae bacterium]|nr:GIY-YIG nuclease family protein [Planctomycetaceae bacterium]